MMEREPDELHLEDVLQACGPATTPLIVACREGHLDVVHWLVSVVGADVEEVRPVN